MAVIPKLFFPARRLITDGVPLIDAHIHTELTDGNGCCKDYILRAKELGLSAIAFTEHADNTSNWFHRFAESKPRLQAFASPLQVYLAAEVKCAHPNGALNLSEDRMARLDFIVGVLHRYPDGKGGYLEFSELSPAEALDLDYQLSMALLANPRVDVIGHPGGVYSTFFGPYDTERMRELVTVAANNGRVVELNSAPRYGHVFPLILEKCLELDCLVSIGSDAHHLEQLGHVVAHLQGVLARRHPVRKASRRGI